MSRRNAPRWPAVSYLAALAGTAVAAYLVSAHYDDSALICTVGDCATVQKSKYAQLWGIPIAILGLAMYLEILTLGVLRWRKPALTGPATVAAFTLALAGALYAAYLTYVELFVIDAICQWCVASAVLTVVILAAESIGVREWITPAQGDNVPPDEPAPAAVATAARSNSTERLSFRHRLMSLRLFRQLFEL